MKYLAFIWFAFIMIESAERNEEICDFFDDFDESLGWYPMQNGNYWRSNCELANCFEPYFEVRQVGVPFYLQIL